MKLLNLKLSNFQGIESFNLQSDGGNILLRGTNAAGKTTLANAITWLLYDKSSTGEKNYTPKTKDKNGADVHFLEHSAEAVFLQDDGVQISIRRVFHEVWKKKRGSATEEFSGHVTEHYLDSVPVSEKQYKERLAQIVDPEQAKMLTIPEYFPQLMSWQARRGILLDVCGNITDEDVINSNSELSALREYLLKPGSSGQSYMVEEYTVIASIQRTKINRDLQSIPTRIDEAKRAMPDLDGIDLVEIERQLAEIAKEKAELEQREIEVTTSGNALAVRQKLAKLNAVLVEKESKYKESISNTNDGKESEIRSLRAKLEERKNEAERAKNKIFILQIRLSELEQMRSELLEKYQEVKAEIWNGKTVCVACGQTIPAEQIEQARENFNLDKSNRLSEINAKGHQKCSKEIIEKTKAEIAEQEKAVEDFTSEIDSLQAEIQAIQETIVSFPPFTETVEYAQIKAEIERVKEQQNNDNISRWEAIKGIQDEIADKTAQIEALQNQKSLFKLAEMQKKRIAELAESEKQLSGEYEKLEFGVYLCELFTKTKVKMLTESINQKFRNVRFRLFTEQINGGISDCCDVLVPCAEGLIPYQSANNAGKINASLEIMDTLGTHYGVTMPIIIDNAESIIKPVETQAQKILLYVDSNYDKLTVI